MKIVVPQQALRQILRWARYGLLTAGIALLAYCGFAVLDSWIFQRREVRQLAQLRTTPTAPGQPRRIFDGGLIGRMEIERLGLSAIVMEGTGATLLQRAAGHIPGTALPGEPGNVGIAAHRDTFFRPLRNVRGGDIIRLSTPLGDYRYRVVSTRIVDPQDVGVLAPSSDQELTLVTCYPFYFVGAAPHRFIVRAVRV